MTEIEQSINEPIEYKIESIAFNGSVFNSAECDWGQSKTVDLISQYHEYLQDKLSRKEYDTIITLESFKDKLASMPVKFISP